MQIESWSGLLQKQQEEPSRNRGIIKDEAGNISAGDGATHTHGPRRLKGRLEVHRELRLCHQTLLNSAAVAQQAVAQHHPTGPGHFVSECTELCWAALQPPQAVHCIALHCSGRVER